MTNTFSYIQVLEREYAKRADKSSNYSMRAFARDLKISSARLSEILNRKSGVSKKRAEILAERLELPVEEKTLFIDSAESCHARSSTAKKLALQRLEKYRTADDWDLILNVDSSQLIEVNALIEDFRAKLKEVGNRSVTKDKGVNCKIRIS